MRIPDKLYWTGKMIASEETPADFLCHYGDAPDGHLRAVLVEAKACSRHRLNFDALKEHQRDALLDFEGMHPHSHGYVALNFYDNVNIRRLNECYMVPISVWEEYRTREEAMKSISREECAADARIAGCPRTGQLFDMKWMVRRLIDGDEA